MYRTLPTSLESSAATNSSFPAKLLVHCSCLTINDTNDIWKWISMHKPICAVWAGIPLEKRPIGVISRLVGHKVYHMYESLVVQFRRSLWTSLRRSLRRSSLKWCLKWHFADHFGNCFGDDLWSDLRSDVQSDLRNCTTKLPYICTGWQGDPLK